MKYMNNDIARAAVTAPGQDSWGAIVLLIIGLIIGSVLLVVTSEAVDPLENFDDEDEQRW